MREKKGRGAKLSGQKFLLYRRLGGVRHFPDHQRRKWQKIKIWKKMKRKKKTRRRLKEGILNRVDRIRTFGPKVRILQHQKRGVTPRVLEIELIPWLGYLLGPSVVSQYNISMCTHQARHLSNHYLLNVENYQENHRIYTTNMRKQYTCEGCLIQISSYTQTLLR